MRKRKSGSDLRRKRRLDAKARLKDAKVKGNGTSEFVTRKEVNEAFQTFSQNLQQLGKVFNENQTALRNAFELVDAHQAVLRRVAEDFMHTRVRPTPLVPEDEEALDIFGRLPHRGLFTAQSGQTINYEWYFEQYNLTLCVIAMAQSIRNFLGLNAAEAEESEPEPEQETEAEFSFGGDYEPNQIHRDAG